ncbi:MAG TPA: penicillin-insensitive murein endopeptidase [Actinophytocola sp.]|uniref:penicillin-insensitive murein endopeptidase n=1 Tax=Actinophytocola sp. TaxID=1872138 RepID=UPI002DDCD265|nr:penicillin-insensitive murein endopeptidase [Actinophytocola sp.]HEV2784231.1 penicillin-insensitive murein endopeptidase [Actinophytocola sp.]
MRRSNLRRLVAASVTTLAAAGVVIVGIPAQAYANAFFHTQSTGNRGVDVQAIQYLLNHHGFAVDPIGVFGPATTTAVRSFQSARGLGVDGTAGPDTWGALVVLLRPGDSGNAVRALQVELNEKRRISLPVNGSYDAATESAVRAFQTHAGIGVDGIAGPVTWRNLVWHYGYPDFAAGICDKDPDGNGTAANWATAAAIGQLEQAVRTFAGTGQGQVPLGDAGFEHGGDIGGHASHEVGLDVDVWPIRTDSAQCTAGRITWQSSTYDRAATRQLVNAIRSAAPGHVRLIFFNDPVLINEGLTTSQANHDNHLHIRYCERVHPNSLYTC